MNEEKVIIESLVMDLKRVSLGLQRGSSKMAERFTQEALARQQELQSFSLPAYVQTLVERSKQALANREAEDLLMYSTLLQNFIQKNYEI